MGAIAFTIGTNILSFIILVCIDFFYHILILEIDYYDREEGKIKKPFFKHAVFVFLGLITYFSIHEKDDINYFYVVAITSIIFQNFIIYKSYEFDKKSTD